ncbi:MAG: twin-arginine translocation signal domain-containing protein [Gammaproteobacteria bacterium]
MKKTNQTSKARRNFLRKAGVLGGATGVGVLAVNVLQSARPHRNIEDDPRENTPSGYRMTEHIRTYYEKARS